MFTKMLVHNISPIGRQYLLVILANFTFLCAGLGLAWTSPMLPKIRDKDNPALGAPITDVETSWIVSTAFISTLLGTVVAVYTNHFLGRKNCIIISGVQRIICYVIILNATSAWMIIIARILAGSADGFSYIAIPSYASEIASKNIRGRLGTFVQNFLNLGVLFMLAVGPYLSYMAMNLIILIICVLATSILIFIPDSPYSLFSRGKIIDCKKMLLQLRGTHEMAYEEMEDFVKLLNKDDKISLIDNLKSITVQKSLTIVFLIGILGTWTGYVALQDYLQTILASTGSTITPQLSSVIAGIILCSAGIFSTVVMDTFNRKPVVIFFYCILSTGMMGLAMYFWRYEGGYKISTFMNVVPLISVIFCFIGHNAEFMLLALICEIFEGPARGIGIGCSLLTSSLSAFAVTWFMYPMIFAIGASWTFFLYGCIGLLLSLYIFLFLPETKGKSFNEIQIALGTFMFVCCISDVSGWEFDTWSVVGGWKLNCYLEVDSCGLDKLARANFTLLCAGLGQAWTSPMLPKLSDKDSPILGVPITDVETSWIVSTAFISTLLGTIVTAYTIHFLGRKNCMVISGVQRIICYIIILNATSAWMIIIARILVGSADGFSYIANPSYASEVASKNNRGRLGTFGQNFINLGLLLMLAVGPYLSYMAMNLIILISCVLATALLIFIPDSPYSLFSRGKKSRCKKVLLQLRGTRELAKEEMEDFVKLLNKDDKISLKDNLKSRSVKRSLTIAFIVGIFCSWTGYIALQDYLQTILARTGSTITPQFSSVIAGIILCSAGIFSTIITDKFNRKPVVIFFYCTLSSDGLSNILIYKISTFMNVLPLISVILCFIGHNAEAILWAIICEIFEGPARGIGIACTIHGSSFGAFTVTWFLYPMIFSIGACWTFFLYGCMGLLFILYIKFFVPETKGKSINEIQIALGKKIPKIVKDVTDNDLNKYVFK